MKYPPIERDSKPAAGLTLKRRGVLLGTGVAAVAGLAVAAVSRKLEASPPEPVALAAKDGDAQGYRLSPHVLRYYETTRL